MNLVIKRKQSGGTRPTFSLWGQLELDEEEQALYKKYKLGPQIICEGSEMEIFEKGNSTTLAIWTTLGLLALAAMMAPGPTMSFFFGSTGMIGIISLIAGFFIIRQIIYNMTRTNIKAADMVNGRNFKCKSIMNMNDQEELIRKIALHMRQLLEDMKNWGGKEVMRMDPMKTRQYEFEESHARLEKEPKRRVAAA